MSSVLHLQRKRNELQKHYDLLSEKIQSLRIDYAIETNFAIRSQLEEQVEQAEEERQNIKHELEAIDRKLIQDSLSRNKFPFLSGWRFCLAVPIFMVNVQVKTQIA